MYKAQIVLHSISERNVELTTMQVTFPRFILAEFNTHRQFSRNSASSRAIPVAKRIAEVRQNPFVPEVFTANQKGMQGGEPLEGDSALRARNAWLAAADAAVVGASILAECGVHKQSANRLLEPFLWHTVVVSATQWSNFFAQRCHPDAQPEIRKIAEMMRDAQNASAPTKIGIHEHHLPYILPEERDIFPVWQLRCISVARCARVSYRTNTDDGTEGEVNPAADLELFQRLVDGGHWSPFEHIATPALDPDYESGNFSGWLQYRKEFRDECR